MSFSGVDGRSQRDAALDQPRLGDEPTADGPNVRTDGPQDGPKPDGPKPDTGAPPTPDEGTLPPPDQGIPPTPDQGKPTAGHYFPAGSIWTKDVSSAPLQSNSSAIINWLANAGGWGTGQMRIDFSIEVLRAKAGTPFRAFTPTGDHYSPDCDTDKVPIVAGGAIEGESGYECVSDGDCHLIVVHEPTHKLYEMWRANISGGTFYGGCLAVWDLTKVYPLDGRGEGCTSADAAGYPIAPLLFTADEVKAGTINHAIRFILPNSRIRNMAYVHPATHSTSAASGGANSLPYGARLRLKASFDISKLSAGAQVVAKAMKTYGMFLADGGSIALTAQSDRFTTAKWSGLLGSHDLSSLKITDFEVVKYESSIVNYSFNCVRN
ncbi:MAG: hypothetical protein CSA65_08405 [Proteobacteria bacterium]|nr:MAG: hypothetical protein CSB49_03410 [Pseudomonadota bacterium]PIE17635.1 MAG: hypothetical protein CSA65_08405 [Pseudomonadota bacterium]